MEKNDYYIRKYHATSNVAYRSIASVLNAVQTNSDWGTCLHQFNSCLKQVDSLWQDMEPVFSLIVPVPKKPISGESIPNLLNSSISRENASAIIVPEAPSNPSREAFMKRKFEQHNIGIDEVLETIQIQIDQGKSIQTSKRMRQRE